MLKCKAYYAKIMVREEKDMASLRCESCGAPKRREDKGECSYCGTRYQLEEKEQKEGGTYQSDNPQSHSYSRTYEQTAASSYNAVPKELSRRIIAAILSLLLGSFGVQFFYVKKTFLGILCIIFCFTAIPSIIGLAQGVIWLTMSDAGFESKYPS